MHFTSSVQLPSEILTHIGSFLKPEEQLLAGKTSKAFRDASRENMQRTLNSLETVLPTVQQITSCFNGSSFKKATELFSLLHIRSTPSSSARKNAFYLNLEQGALESSLRFAGTQLQPTDIFRYACQRCNERLAQLVPEETKIDPMYFDELTKGFHRAVKCNNRDLIRMILLRLPESYRDVFLSQAIENKQKNLIDFLLSLGPINHLVKSFNQAVSSSNAPVLTTLFDANIQISKEVDRCAGYNCRDNREQGLQKAIHTAIRKADLPILQILVERGEPNREMLTSALLYANDLAVSLAETRSLEEFIVPDINTKANREALNAFITSEAEKCPISVPVE